MIGRAAILLPSAILAALLTLPVSAQQIHRLPPVIPPESPFSAQRTAPLYVVPPDENPNQLAAFVDPHLEQATPNTGIVPAPRDPRLPQGAKPGQVLQRINFVNTLVGGADQPDDFENYDIELRVSLGFPFPTVDTPLVVTPGLGIHLLDGPDSPDVPARVYDSFVDLMWKLPLGEAWMVDLAITPGLYSDFEGNTSDALRVGGRVIVTYTPNFLHKFAAGLLYLDREDVPFLPVGGYIYSPDDDTRLEFLFPRPKFSRRHLCQGEFEIWYYLAGELGGGAWAVERLGSVADMLYYRDWRVMVGQEIKRSGSSVAWVEIGYVFNRTIEYESGTEFDPQNALMVRAALGY